MAVGSRHESVGGRKPCRASGGMPRSKCGTRGSNYAYLGWCGGAICGTNPAGGATNDLVSSLGAYGLSTCSIQVAPLLLCDRDLSGGGPYAAWASCASCSAHGAPPTCPRGPARV